MRHTPPRWLDIADTALGVEVTIVDYNGEIASCELTPKDAIEIGTDLIERAEPLQGTDKKETNGRS